MIRPIRYKITITMTVVMTTKSSILGFVKVSNTLSKSMGFGCMKKSPPNVVR